MKSPLVSEGDSNKEYASEAQSSESALKSAASSTSGVLVEDSPAFRELKSIMNKKPGKYDQVESGSGTSPSGTPVSVNENSNTTTTGNFPNPANQLKDQKYSFITCGSAIDNPGVGPNGSTIPTIAAIQSIAARMVCPASAIGFPVIAEAMTIASGNDSRILEAIRKIIQVVESAGDLRRMSPMIVGMSLTMLYFLKMALNMNIDIDPEDCMCTFDAIDPNFKITARDKARKNPIPIVAVPGTCGPEILTLSDATITIRYPDGNTSPKDGDKVRINWYSKTPPVFTVYFDMVNAANVTVSIPAYSCNTPPSVSFNVVTPDSDDTDQPVINGCGDPSTIMTFSGNQVITLSGVNFDSITTAKITLFNSKLTKTYTGSLASGSKVKFTINTTDLTQAGTYTIKMDGSYVAADGTVKPYTTSSTECFIVTGDCDASVKPEITGATYPDISGNNLNNVIKVTLRKYVGGVENFDIPFTLNNSTSITVNISQSLLNTLPQAEYDVIVCGNNTSCSDIYAKFFVVTPPKAASPASFQPLKIISISAPIQNNTTNTCSFELQVKSSSCETLQSTTCKMEYLNLTTNTTEQISAATIKTQCLQSMNQQKIEFIFPVNINNGYKPKKLLITYDGAEIQKTIGSAL